MNLEEHKLKAYFNKNVDISCPYLLQPIFVDINNRIPKVL